MKSFNIYLSPKEQVNLRVALRSYIKEMASIRHRIKNSTLDAQFINNSVAYYDDEIAECESIFSKLEKF